MIEPDLVDLAARLAEVTSELHSANADIAHVIEAMHQAGNLPHLKSLNWKPESENQDKVLTVGELARRLRVTRRTIRAWTAAGKIPALRVGEKTLRFDWGRVVESLERRGARGSHDHQA